MTNHDLSFLATGSITGHTDTIQSLAYSPTEDILASGSADKTVKVWDVPTILRSSRKGLKRAIHTAASDEQDFSDWILGKDGWILGGPERRDLLMWVPPDLRRTLFLPQNTAICSDFSTKLDFAGAALGERWTECFKEK